MLRNALILFGGIALCIFSPLRSSEAKVAANLAPSKSIIEDMLANTDICQAKMIFAKSYFVKSCESVKFPSPNATLDANNLEQLLCLGIYDRTARLCLLDSQRKVGTNNVIPGDSKTFDDSVVTAPKNLDEASVFCKKWKNVYPPIEKKLMHYVTQLDSAIAKDILCIKMCTTNTGEFIPLCLMLEAMDNLSLAIAKRTEEPQKKKVEDAVRDEKKPKLATDAGTMVQAAPNKDSTANEAPQKQQQSEPPPYEANDNNKQVVEDKNNKGAPSAHGQTQQSKIAVSEPPTEILVVEKPASLPSGPPKETPLEDKAKKVEESGVAAQADVSKAENDKKGDGQAPPPLENVASAPDNPPAPVEDNNEAEKGTEYGGQISKTGDEISEHTQEEPDAVEEMSEIETPGLTNDDIEESPAMPSEKHQEFRPRMPSIRNDDDSHFFGYFTVIGVICIAGYVGYHNKQKIFAMVLEGRRSRGSRGRRRPSTANYRKLDCTLEEAVTSQCNSNVTHVIY